MLTAYRIYLSNGTDYVTSMAKNVTLEDATKYFLGQDLEQPNGMLAKVTKVEEVFPSPSPFHDEYGIHKNDAHALEEIDAVFFTGDPAETRRKYERLKFYVDRWARALAESEKRLERNENDSYLREDLNIK